MLVTQRALVGQLAAQQASRGPPEASGDKKGSSSSVHRECPAVGGAQECFTKGGGDIHPRTWLEGT